MVSVNRAGRPVRAELLVVVVAEVALVAALHWSGSLMPDVPAESLGTWFRTADPADALVMVARLAGLAIAYWLLVTTVLYALSHHLGLTPLTRALRWITLPAVRQVVQGVTAISLTGATLLGPSTVATAPAFAQPYLVAQDTPGTAADTGNGGDPATSYAPDAAGWPDVGAPTSFWLPTGRSAAQAERPAAASSADRYTVVRGDHFWGIAEDQLESWHQRSVTNAEVAPYWVRVVDANRDTIRSGDPDLIFPGEQVDLPPRRTGLAARVNASFAAPFPSARHVPDTGDDLQAAHGSRSGLMWLVFFWERRHTDRRGSWRARTTRPSQPLP